MVRLQPLVLLHLPMQLQHGDAEAQLLEGFEGELDLLASVKKGDALHLLLHLDETPQNVQLLVQRAFDVKLTQALGNDEVVRVAADHLRFYEHRFRALDDARQLLRGARLSSGEEQCLSLRREVSQDPIQLILKWTVGQAIF